MRTFEGPFRIPGLAFRKKSPHQQIVSSLQNWGQNVLLLGESNWVKSFFQKKLLNTVKPKRLVVISNTFARQYQQDGMSLKHYSTMPDSIEDTDIQPKSYVVIDDICVMGLKHSSQRECLQVFHHVQSPLQTERLLLIAELRQHKRYED